MIPLSRSMGVGTVPATCVDHVYVHEPQQRPVVLLHGDREAVGFQELLDPLDAAADVVDLDDELAQPGSVGHVDAPKYLPLRPLDVDLEEVDSLDPAFSHRL